MPSTVDICNMALSHIGNSERINALDEASAQAEQCSLFFESCVDEVLRAIPWGFATAFVDLAEVTINPDTEYPYCYAMPVDCLLARRIVNSVWPVGYYPFPCDYQLPQIPPIQFRVINGSSGRLISTTVSPAKLEYTTKLSTPEIFDPIFVSALSWKLAAKVAPALSRDANIAQVCEQQYQYEIRNAGAASFNEAQRGPQPESSFISVRS
ncbi:hypothetical protein [Pseudomonas aeruginosa]|uniref:hypothetical protein n=1 Tax=Pseudomonas aeruginosa TaxID=287 RepID=UPI003006EB55